MGVHLYILYYTKLLSISWYNWMLAKHPTKNLIIYLQIQWRCTQGVSAAKKTIHWLSSGDNWWRDGTLKGKLCVFCCSVMSVSLQAYGLLPASLLCPWNFPGKNTGVDCHFLLQGTFPNQQSNLSLLHLLHWQADSLPLHYLGSPKTRLTPSDWTKPCPHPATLHWKIFSLWHLKLAHWWCIDYVDLTITWK